MSTTGALIERSDLSLSVCVTYAIAQERIERTSARAHERTSVRIWAGGLGQAGPGTGSERTHTLRDVCACPGACLSVGACTLIT